jgi:hypothetical protein
VEGNRNQLPLSSLLVGGSIGDGSAEIGVAETIVYSAPPGLTRRKAPSSRGDEPSLPGPPRNRRRRCPKVSMVRLAVLWVMTRLVISLTSTPWWVRITAELGPEGNFEHNQEVARPERSGLDP